MKFIDEIEITVTSGAGGPGSISFRREAKVPRGGPDGGDGGRGGHILFEVDQGLNSLIHFRNHKKYIAQNGLPGGGSHSSGKDGDDIILRVPPGTIVMDRQSNVLLDMTNQEQVVFLKGGLGGKGNSFYKTSVNQAPMVAQNGMPGQSMDLRLELKLIADVGIIGFPNAGKSTLISHLSAARPKIADYPFTTLTPNLGVVDLNGERSCVLADIPGLIEGASEGVGLGHQFLRHIERTRFFIHVIDSVDLSGREPLEDFKTINNELKKYDMKNDLSKEKALSSRKQIVLLNKADAAGVDRIKLLERQFKDLGYTTLTVSAATGYKLPELKFKILEELKTLDGGHLE